jgi:hypothetical protein
MIGGTLITVAPTAVESSRQFGAVVAALAALAVVSLLVWALFQTAEITEEDSGGLADVTVFQVSRRKRK